MGIQEKILAYLSVYGKENKYRLATSLKIEVIEVTKALELLREEGIIEIKEGKAIIKRAILAAKAKKRKKPKVAIKKEKPEEAEEEQPQAEVSEEPAEEVQETFGVKTEEEFTKERVEGTVKFFNPNKGFGFITGDDGKEYYVNKDGLKEGVTIETGDKVSFKVVQGDKGPKAEEVEKINEDVEENAS